MAVYYNQTDYRWGNHPYTSSAHPSATLKTSGCGPTSGAMVVSTLVGTMLPDAIADLFKSNGFRANEGTDLKAFNWLAEYYGLKVQQTTNLDDAVNCLHRGGIVVASCNAGLFSTDGHIIVLAGMKDANTIIVYDPYLYNNKFNQYNRNGKVTVNGNDVYCSMQNFNSYTNCKAFFCYEKKEEKKSDLQYQVHLEDKGWMSIQNAGEGAGTENQSRRIEAVKFFGNNGLEIKYRAHVQDIGWQDWKNSGEIAGTTGECKRIEAIEIQCNKVLEVQEHVENVGWMPKFKSTSFVIGTVGKALRLEAFRINVIG